MSHFQVHDAENFEDSPCTDERRQNDWFIPDNVTADVIEEYTHLTIVPLEHANADQLKDRRDAARRACYDECPMAARLLCLSEGLRPENSAYGIWGGYTEGQRRAVTKAASEMGRTIKRRPLAKAMIVAEKREPRST